MSETASSTGNFNIIAFVEFGLGPENLPFGMEFFPLRLCSRLSSMPTSPSSTGLAPFFGLCGSTPAQKSELRAHQMARNCGVPGSLRTKSELSSHQMAHPGQLRTKKSELRAHQMAPAG